MANESKETKSNTSGKKAPKLADLMQPLSRTGNDVPSGTYPAFFSGFGEPYYHTEQFQGKPPEDKLCLRMHYLVRLPNGEVERQSERVNLGRDPKSVNIKSKLYKRLTSIASGDVNLINKEGGFGKDVTFQTFTGRPIILGIKSETKGDRVFTNIDNAAAPMPGLNYPTAEDAARFAEQMEQHEETEEEDVPIE